MNNDLEISTRLHGLLLQRSRDRERFAGEVERLQARYGKEVYPVLFFATAHLKFSVRSAARHWKAVLRHWEGMRRLVGKDVDFRVALLDYFLDVDRRIRDPKIIESTIFEKTLQDTFIDELTGLYNYRFFLQALRKEVTRANRYAHPLSLVMYDVDDFKHYNDVNGHPEGSRALAKLAGIIRKTSRDVDVVARYGGEEFAVILPETDKEGALAIAERTRRKVVRSAFRNAEQQPLKRLTISGGVATLNVDARVPASLVKKADQALYLAKSLGKNRVVAYGRERRRFPRVNGTVRTLVSVVSEGGERYLPRNISEGGLLMQGATAPDAGAHLPLTMRFRDGSRRIPFTASVRRVDRDRESGTYDIGARITGIRKEEREALRDFVRSLAPSLS